MIEDAEGRFYHYMIEPRSGKVDDIREFSVFDEPTIKRIWEHFSGEGSVRPTEVAGTEMVRYVIWRGNGTGMYLNRWEVYPAGGGGYDRLIEIDFDLVLKGDDKGLSGEALRTKWALWKDQHHEHCWTCWYIEQRRDRFCVEEAH